MLAPVLALTLAGLTPSEDLAVRMASLEARRESIDQRRPAGYVLRVSTAFAYAASAGAMLWALGETFESLSFLFAPKRYQPAMPIDGLAIGGLVSLAVAAGLNVGMSIYNHRLDAEADEVAAEAEELAAERDVDIQQRWRALK